ncbi:MAG: GNAT family N-acetyltransferase [Gammaproteobacteria bacterium]|nr:GNAT family N-acetyltransferase [Gammaproteobacteria bacterium]
MQQLNFRKAIFDDLSAIVQLLTDDDLGKHRETTGDKLAPCYEQAFALIDKDPNQYLMVILSDKEIVGTCHLTLMPSLTYRGSKRMQIEAVRVSKKYRRQKIGEWMMLQALQFAKENQVKIVQLTTNKLRSEAKRFYERIGFNATHEGMKYHLGDE